MHSLTRTSLKYIALICMLIDHIGAIIGREFFVSTNLLWLYYVFRIIGRIAFPIFAFFLSVGWQRTSNKKKYVLTILLFAIITQPIYYFALNTSVFSLNILFTFLVSILVFYLTDLSRKYKDMRFLYIIFIAVILLSIFAFETLGIVFDYGIYGVLICTIFYLFYDSKIKYSRLVMWILFSLITIIYCSINLISNFIFDSVLQIFSLLSIILLVFYRGENGKKTSKYLFYIFYPAHILVIYLISLLI